jgi:protein-S-isoprenylcysteine O-methyltransferase Ste14
MADAGQSRQMTKLNAKAVASLLILFVVIAGLIFTSAGTLHYWQGWTFLLVYFMASLAITLDLMWRDPALLARRMSGGPWAEREPTQRRIMVITSVGFIALIVIPGLDRRFGWSDVPSLVALGGDVLILLGFVGIRRVFTENSYTSATIELASDQRVISSGPYAVVRHPMYAAALLMLSGFPVALGSRWALLVIAVILPALIWRLLDEERFLAKNLRGYREYQGKVRYRLLPSVW